jgi:hypothetical protein
MGKNSIILITAFVTIVIILIIIKAQTTNDFKSKSLDEKRSEILSEIDMTLKEAEESGKYNCCMNPPCKMCLLGNWIWKDGSCKCDVMIAKGELDKVCPECKRNLKDSNGKCPL